MIRSIFLVGTLISSIFLSVALGCGISTHTEIGYRAIEYLGYSDQESAKFIRDILLNNQV